MKEKIIDLWEEIKFRACDPLLWLAILWGVVGITIIICIIYAIVDYGKTEANVTNLMITVRNIQTIVRFMP